MSRIAWDTLKHHTDFIANTEKYVPVKDGLTSVMDELTYFFHVNFSTDPTKALTAPLTEVAIWTLKDGASDDKLVSLIATLIGAMHGIPVEAGGVGGATWGPVVENDKQFAVLYGWKDLKVSILQTCRSKN